ELLATRPKHGCPGADSAQHLPVTRRVDPDQIATDSHVALQPAQPLPFGRAIRRLDPDQRLAPERPQQRQSSALHLPQGRQATRLELGYLDGLHAGHDPHMTRRTGQLVRLRETLPDQPRKSTSRPFPSARAASYTGQAATASWNASPTPPYTVTWSGD